MVSHSAKDGMAILGPKISVITPAYNAQKYIAEAIESLQSQTFADYEHLIINDGSSDKTAKIVEKYAKEDHRIKLISQNNAGAAAARNRGLELAGGEYITFLDGDDLMEADTLNVLLSTVHVYHNDLVCFRKDLLYDDSGEIHDESFFYKNNPLPSVFCPATDIAHETFFFTSAPLDVVGFYRKDFIVQNKLKFNTNYQRNEDFLFKAEALLCAQKVSFIDRGLYHYRVGMESNASSTLDTHKDVGWKILLELQRLIKQGKHKNNKNVYKSLQIISCEFLWHYIFNMKTYEGQKYAFDKVKSVAGRLGINALKNPGDIYTSINFYKEIQDHLRHDYDKYLWARIQENVQHIDDLSNRVSTLDQVLSGEVDRRRSLADEVAALKSSISWKVTRPIRLLSGLIKSLNSKT